MTVQLANTLAILSARHGYAASIVNTLGYGVFLVSVGGILYRIRGDGSIL